jgi:Tol biopolymer transport system component
MAGRFCRLSIVLVAWWVGLALDPSPLQLVVLRQALPASTELSAATDGGAVSGDGRFVAFVSRAQLLSTATRGVDHVYVFDRLAGTVTLETAAADGSRSNGTSLHPRLSANGRYLVFASAATNLIAGPDTNGTPDIFVRDRLVATTKRVSLGRRGQESNDTSAWPAISNDGQVTVFASSATNLVDDTDANGDRRDIYLARLVRGELDRVSVDSNGRQPADGESFSPSISGDGRVVAFASTASLGQAAERRLPGAVRPPVAVFVRDLASGTTTCASCGGIADGIGRRAYDPQLSDDGRYVVFTVSHESGSRSISRRTDVAVHDRASSRTTVITRRANAGSTRPRISGNGQFIAFQSLASNLACEKRCAAEAVDENLLPDVYLFDRQTETFTRLSRGAEEWWAPSIAPWLDAEGRVVIFSSRQPVGPDDPTTDFDLFVRSLDRTTAVARPTAAREVRAAGHE